MFTSDVIYIWTDKGWLYLAAGPVQPGSCRLVIKPRMTADIVTDALMMAWFRRSLSRVPCITRTVGPRANACNRDRHQCRLLRSVGDLV